MATVAISDLITRVRTKSSTGTGVNGLNDSNISDTEIAQFIGEGLADLQDEVSIYDLDYFRTGSIVTCDGSNRVSLPEDFYILRGVDRVSGTNRIRVKPYNFANRNHHNANWDVWSCDEASFRYRLAPPNLEFDNAPPNGTQLEIYYVPEVSYHTGSTVNIPQNWTEFAVTYAVIEVLSIEESDTSKHERRLAKLRDRIIIKAQQRDTSFPASIVDSEGFDPWGV